MQNWEGWILSNRQLGIRVDIRIVMIMVLEYKILPHPTIVLLRTRCSRTKTFINTSGRLLVGRLTFRPITNW